MFPEHGVVMVTKWLVVAHSSSLRYIFAKITSGATDKVMDGLDERGLQLVIKVISN